MFFIVTNFKCEALVVSTIYKVMDGQTPKYHHMGYFFTILVQNDKNSPLEYYNCFPYYTDTTENINICRQPVVKEGYLMKQTRSFQRWQRRYFRLRGRTLYYAKEKDVSHRYNWFFFFRGILSHTSGLETWPSSGEIYL